MRTKKVTLFFTPSFRRIVEEEREKGIFASLTDLGPVMQEVAHFHSMISNICIFGPILASETALLSSSLRSKVATSPLEERMLQEVMSAFKLTGVADKFERTTRVEIRVSYCPPIQTGISVDAGRVKAFFQTGFSADTIKIEAFFYDRAQDALILIDMDLKAVDGSVLVCTITPSR